MESPHVVILPFPAQGHIKPMIMLAELLSQADFTISFVNTEHNHRRILNTIDGTDFRRRCPGIELLSIPDGLPPDHPRSGPSIVDLLVSIPTASKPFLRSLIAGMCHAPSCIIFDGIMSFAVDVAAELGIPAIAFRTYSATATWINFHLEKLINDGEIPVQQAGGELDKLIPCIPGLDHMMRRRDLPSICRLAPENPIMQFYITQSINMRKASALILNTFEQLESPIISHLQSIFPTVYAIGPLHAALKSTAHYSTPHQSSSLLQFDQSCLQWLDSQQPKSVLYVSFGSVAVLNRDELMEFWYGLVNSEKTFLWAIRPGLIWDDNGPDGISDELKMGLERGRIVDWAPKRKLWPMKLSVGF